MRCWDSLSLCPETKFVLRVWGGSKLWPYMLQGSLTSKLSTVQWVHTGEGEDGKTWRWKWSVQVCKTLLSAYRWQGLHRSGDVMFWLRDRIAKSRVHDDTIIMMMSSCALAKSKNNCVLSEIAKLNVQQVYPLYGIPSYSILPGLYNTCDFHGCTPIWW